MSRCFAFPVALAISVAATLTLCWRMLHGFDFTDEAFYIALPQRFALGDRPFVDELNLAQSASLILYPFVKLYMLIVGDATGIFLFIRALFIVLFGFVGWSVFALARTCGVQRPAALLCATMCPCFFPLSIPGLGYNTLGMSFLAAGLFVAARALLVAEPQRRFWRAPMFWAGFLHGTASLAYPSLVLIAAVTAINVAVLSRRQRLLTTMRYVAGGFVVAAIVSPLLIRAGVANVKKCLLYLGGVKHVFTMETVRERMQEYVSLHPHLPVALLAVVSAMILVRRLPLLGGAYAVILPLFACGSLQVGYMASMGFMATFALFGPLLIVVIRERRVACVLAFCILVPSLVAGVVFCVSSGNKALSASNGLYPAAIASAMILAMFITQSVAAARWPIIHPYLALAPAVALAVLVHCLTMDDAYYRDGPRSAMTEYVSYGPVKGIYTTPRNAHLLKILTTDIESYVQGKRALFFYDLPIGYLIANRRPMVSSTWIFAAAPRHRYDMALFQKWAKPGELVIFDWDHQYPLEQEVARRCDIVALRPEYTVYRVR